MKLGRQVDRCGGRCPVKGTHIASTKCLNCGGPICDVCADLHDDCCSEACAEEYFSDMGEEEDWDDEEEG